MSYFDGFVLPIPTSRKEEYRQFALAALPLFREFGATRMVEAWGDDVPDGKLTDFRKTVLAEEGETVVFSWVDYGDKQIRNEAARKMMEDPRMENMGDMPFDGKRMIYAGFQPEIDHGPGGSFGYVDGTLIAVPTAAKAAYLSDAARQAEALGEQGATRIVIGWGDDVTDGKLTDFKRAVLAAADETVVFGWVEWPSRRARDAAWAKLMADTRMHGREALVDEQRRIYGGFVPIVDG